MTCNFHKNSDVDCLYIRRSEGRRGLKSIRTAQKCRPVSLNHQLTKNRDSNQLMSIVCQSQENESKTVACERHNKYNFITDINEIPGAVGQKYLKLKNKERASSYQSKAMENGYIAKEIQQ